MTKTELRKEQRSILIKIALLIPALVAAFMLLCTLKVKACDRTYDREFEAPRYANSGRVEVKTSFQTLTGPSQSFLNDFGYTEEYVLELDNKTIRYDVYASGVLDDGTIVFAAEDYICLAVRPSGALVVAEWGNRFVPKKIYYAYRLYPKERL